MNIQLKNLIDQYKKEFGKPLENAVSVDKSLKLALNQLLETPTVESEQKKALVAGLYDAFHTVKGTVINTNGLYKKTKYFKYDNKTFEVFIKLQYGEVTHGINIIQHELENVPVNYII